MTSTTVHSKALIMLLLFFSLVVSIVFRGIVLASNSLVKFVVVLYM